MTAATWYADALCAQTDPESFFPSKGGSSTDAKRVCRRCPARPDCLDWALETNQSHGVWGGTSSSERRALRRTERRG